MARKRPAKKSSGAKTAKAAAKSRAAKKPAKKAGAKISRANTKASAKVSTRGAKAAKAAKKSSAAKSKTNAAKKARASKAVRKAAATRTTKRAPGATLSKRAASKSIPAARRSTPRISAGRRATPRKVSSREALAKKTLAKPVAVRKPAKKRPAKRAPATKAAGKTARSRLAARAAQKLAAPVLRDGARRRVVKPTAPRPEPGAAPARRGPFRLHSLGVRDEHPTDRSGVEALLREAFGRTDEAVSLDQLRAKGDIALSLVAEYENAIVGHVAFSNVDARLDGRAVKALALASLAVSPLRQGKGVGSVLVAAGLEAARTAGFEAVFVVGDAAYHNRFGFSAEVAASFESIAKGDLLALELESGALSGRSGTLGASAALRR
jgi:putative acetyltransferase